MQDVPCCEEAPSREHSLRDNGGQPTMEMTLVINDNRQQGECGLVRGEVGKILREVKSEIAKPAESLKSLLLHPLIHAHLIYK